MSSHLFQQPRLYRTLALTAAFTSAAALAISGAAQASAATSQPGSLASQAAVASAAIPHSGISNCPQYSLCLWQNSGYTGNMWFWSWSMTPHETGIWVGGSANDQASSLYNDRDDVSEVGKNYPMDDDSVIIYMGSSNSNLANSKWPDGTSMNDSISSIALLTAS
jgi:Peptidase inhibitor family I36